MKKEDRAILKEWFDVREKLGRDITPEDMPDLSLKFTKAMSRYSDEEIFKELEAIQDDKVFEEVKQDIQHNRITS